MMVPLLPLSPWNQQVEQDRPSSVQLHHSELARKPLVSLEVIASLIAATTTANGLKVQAALDTNTYPPGLKVSDEDFARVQLRRDKFHGEWNYRVTPRATDKLG